MVMPYSRYRMGKKRMLSQAWRFSMIGFFFLWEITAKITQFTCSGAFRSHLVCSSCAACQSFSRNCKHFKFGLNYGQIIVVIRKVMQLRKPTCKHALK